MAFIMLVRSHKSLRGTKVLTRRYSMKKIQNSLEITSDGGLLLLKKDSVTFAFLLLLQSNSYF